MLIGFDTTAQGFIVEIHSDDQIYLSLHCEDTNSYKPYLSTCDNNLHGDDADDPEDYDENYNEAIEDYDLLVYKYIDQSGKRIKFINGYDRITGGKMFTLHYANEVMCDFDIPNPKDQSFVKISGKTVWLANGEMVSVWCGDTNNPNPNTEHDKSWRMDNANLYIPDDEYNYGIHDSTIFDRKNKLSIARKHNGSEKVFDCVDDYLVVGESYDPEELEYNSNIDIGDRGILVSTWLK